MISRNNWTRAGSMFCKRLCNKLVRFSRLPQGRHASASNAGPEWALRSLILQHCPKIRTQRSHCAQPHVGGFPFFDFKKKRNKQNTMDTGYLMTKLNNWWVEICKEILLRVFFNYQTRIIFRLTICYLYFLYLFHSRQSVLIKVFLII